MDQAEIPSRPPDDQPAAKGTAPAPPAGAVVEAEHARESAPAAEGTAAEDRGGGGEAPSVDLDDLRPVEIVRRLDEYIVGQTAAKRSVAVALRNRVRRRKLPDELRQEVLPKNILMIGPTGVGKTEIARRLARLTNSPFIKTEATKFTEVGYVGRDVESIVRDLLEQTITEVHNERSNDVQQRARELAESRILDALAEAEEKGAAEAEAARRPAAVDGSAPGEPVPTDGDTQGPPEQRSAEERRRRLRARRRRLERKMAARALEERYVEIEVEEPFQPVIESFTGTQFEEMGVSLSDFFSQLAPPRKRLKRMTVADAREALAQEETDRLIDMDRVYDDAIRMVEDDGIVFVDEVDKIAGRGTEHGPDVSGEGVQRDLLPILEGSTVHTRYGSVRTDHILFVAAGAFNVSRPSDLIPEFQGRFPIRVELSPLAEADLERILVEPSNALTKQYEALMRTEDVELRFSPDGLRELAHAAARINEEDENIGARRLFTILEKVLEDLSFRADEFAGQSVTVDGGYVRDRLVDLVRNEDLRRYVL